MVLALAAVQVVLASAAGAGGANAPCAETASVQEAQGVNHSSGVPVAHTEPLSVTITSDDGGVISPDAWQIVVDYSSVDEVPYFAANDGTVLMDNPNWQAFSDSVEAAIGDPDWRPWIADNGLFAVIGPGTTRLMHGDPFTGTDVSSAVNTATATAAQLGVTTPAATITVSGQTGYRNTDGIGGFDAAFFVSYDRCDVTAANDAGPAAAFGSSSVVDIFANDNVVAGPNVAATVESVSGAG